MAQATRDDPQSQQESQQAQAGAEEPMKEKPGDQQMAASEQSSQATDPAATSQKKDPQAGTASEPTPEQPAQEGTDAKTAAQAEQQSQDARAAAQRKAATERRERARERREAAQRKSEEKSFLQELNDASPVPIPAILGVLGAGLLGFGAFRWMRKRKAATDGEEALTDLDVTDHGDSTSDDQAFADSDISGDTGAGSSTDVADELSGGSSDDLSLGVGTVDEDIAQHTLIDAADTVDEIEAGQETSVTTQPIDGDEDPLAEVNVYLAYERFDQAEQLVQNAVQNYPERDDYKLKLLEVYQASGDTEKFEQAASSLRDKVGEDSPLFQQAKGLWDQMSVGRGLLAGAGLAAAGAAAASAVVGEGSIFDVTEREGEVLGDAEATNVDFDLGFDLDSEDSSAASSALDLDLGQPASEPSDDAAAGAESGLDFDLASLDAPGSADVDSSETGLDFDLGDLDEASSLAEAGQDAGGESMLDFDLGDLDEDTQALGGARYRRRQHNGCWSRRRCERVHCCKLGG